MLFWSLFLLLSNLGLGRSASVEVISANVHVATNDHMVVFARNRDSQFHITFRPYKTPAVLLHLQYLLVETKAVRSLVIPRRAPPHGLIDLVFIGERHNSSEMVLFHARLQRDETTGRLSVVRLVQTSIASLSSAGVECALGIHPRGTHVFVVGDQVGLVCEMNESLVYNWSLWDEYRDKRHPKVVSVAEDDYVIVGFYLQLIDIIIPAFYEAQFYSNGSFDPNYEFAVIEAIEIPNIQAPMSMALRGSLDGDGFAMAVGLPSVDSVFLVYRVESGSRNGTIHKSVEGDHFGQAVIFAANNTYGVLSSGLATPPWSTGRVQVRSVFQAAISSTQIFNDR